MTATIRRATLSDLDVIAPLFDAYRQFYSQPADVTRARAWLQERLQSGESVVLVAEHAGEAVGFTQLYRMFSSVRTARTWILNDLFVAESARRFGVARALLDAAAQFARDDGATGISLETTSDNAPARALYRAAGWSEDHTQWYSLSWPAPSEELLFSYGTLQDEAVQLATFGRRLAGTADTLPGYRRSLIEITDPQVLAMSSQTHHPIVIASDDPADQVPGTVLRITPQELSNADEYEVDDYRRVRVQLASGLAAWVYVQA